MTITNKAPQDWKDLQNKVAEILNGCGFQTEIEKKAKTARGNVEIDVYAEESVMGRKYSIICECKYWKSNIPQNIIHGFRTVVSDLGCNVGYIITTSDFQSGSVNASEYSNIELLTWENFQTKFFESWFESYFSPQLTKYLDPLLTYSEPLLPKWFDKLTSEEKQAFFSLKDQYDVFGMIVMTFTTYARMFNKHNTPTLPLIDRVRENQYVIDRIPADILNETGYQEFLEMCCAFGGKAIAEFRYFRDKYATDLNED